MIETVVEAVVADVLASTQVIDIHTHLFAPGFGSLGLWGIDHLLTYHYLEAELFRSAPTRPEEYWTLSLAQRADLIWKTLFVVNNPISEATRGVIAVLDALGLDPSARTLQPYRHFFREQNLPDHIGRVFKLAGIESVVMTNDPLDPEESPLWNDLVSDTRFRAALRLDRLLNQETTLTPAKTRDFLEGWVTRMRAVYMAVSLPDSFQFPANDRRNQFLTEAVLPACRDLNIPLSLMIGVRRQVNPAIRLAGDASGRADLRSIETLCREFPDNRFLVSVLSRENQHELCVYARKFANLMPFDCWWFLNNPSVVEEITRERLEMLGTSFIPQHSDARILEQVIYKWRNTRRTLAPILAKSYRLLAEDGRAVTRADIERDVQRLFRTNFQNWTSR
ncbi:MAG: glucuronate isomerase [Acidobacteriia bacterium]|nr:glucuronate isomerase [Terriglobia bacterium]